MRRLALKAMAFSTPYRHAPNEPCSFRSRLILQQFNIQFRFPAENGIISQGEQLITQKFCDLALHHCRLYILIQYILRFLRRFYFAHHHSPELRHYEPCEEYIMISLTAPGSLSHGHALRVLEQNSIIRVDRPSSDD